MSGEASGADKPVAPVYGADRSAARLAAVQALYQMDMAQTDLNGVIAEFMGHRLDKGQVESDVAGGDPAFFADLLKGVLSRQREIDPMLDQQLAGGWRLARIDSILRAMLRVAAYELLARSDIPARVIINEYIDIAHSFFDADEPKVVNGVLDKLARKLREGEFKASG